MTNKKIPEQGKSNLDKPHFGKSEAGRHQLSSFYFKPESYLESLFPRICVALWHVQIPPDFD
jgi:hypothetical protein